MDLLLRSPSTLANDNSHSSRDNPLRTSSNLGSSTLNDYSSNEDCRSGSECSECGGIPSSSGGGSSTPSMRRIALAKQILDEATSSFTPSLSISAAKTDKCKNNGALGPLLIMMQNEQNTEKLRGCLDTLAFLLLDKANRKVINEIHGLDVIMGLFSRTQDPTVLCSALDAVCSLVRTDDADKARVWSHPGKAGVLGMLSNPSLGCARLCEVLCMIRKIAFTSSSNGKEPELLEPGLLPTLASMLQLSLPQPALLRALKVLKLCTCVSGPQHLPSWNLAVFNLVPLLKDSMVSEEVLHVLLQLSERAEFKNAFMAAGTIPPLLALLINRDKSVPIAAVCVLSSLSDAGRSCDQLLQEPSLLALLRALQLNQHVEVSIGVLYTLNRLACGRPHVAAFLRQRGATQVLRKLLQDWTDEDLCLGASQLLGILGASAAPPHSAAPATHAHSNVHAASNAHAASNVHTASATQPAHSNVQASPSTSALPSSHAPHTPSSAPPHSTGRSASLNGTAIANGPPSHANGSAFAAPTALHCDASHTGASSHSNSGSAGDASAGDQNQDRRGDGFVSTISHGLEGSGTSLSSATAGSEATTTTDGTDDASSSPEQQHQHQQQDKMATLNVQLQQGMAAVASKGMRFAERSGSGVLQDGLQIISNMA